MILDKRARKLKTKKTSNIKHQTSNITIIGPGAIGSLFAALLARAGHNVTLLDHNQKRSEERNISGITIIEDSATWHTHIKSSANAKIMGIANLVFICTKAYDTADATKYLPLITDKNTTLISLQNGIGNVEQIVKHAPRHTICATTAMAALRKNSTTIHWTGKGTTNLAPFQNSSADNVNKVATLLTNANCPCEILDDAQSMLWGKLIINAAINPVTAIHNITNGELLENPKARKQAFAAAKEAEAVATALGVILPYSDLNMTITETCQTTSSNQSSMLQDIKNHRRTEIDSITGAIISEAKRLGIPTPINQILYDAVISTA